MTPDDLRWNVIPVAPAENPVGGKTTVASLETMRSEKLEGFDAFIAVADTGGFAAAARRLGMTTSAVSKQVGKLEARLDARLFRRTTRRLSVTEAGHALLAHARRAVAEAQAGREAVAELGSEPRGLLRLTTPLSFGILHVAPAIAQFLARHPGMRIEMMMDDRVQDLVAGGYDLAIRSGALKGAGSVVARRLVASDVVLCASPDYISRRGQPRTPEDLLEHDTMLHTYYPEGNEWVFEGPRGRVSVTLAPRYATNNALALRAVALDGGGILRTTRIIVDEEFAARRLVPVLPEWRLPPIELHAVFPDRAYIPLKARAFVEFLKTRLAGKSFTARG